MSSIFRPASLHHAFLLALAIRLPLALLQQTPFQPDETYQALEPAHDIVFGTGFLTWEWQWNAPVQALSEKWAWLGEGRLRSSAWVGIWAAVYWLLRVLGLDDALIVRRQSFVREPISPAAHLSQQSARSRLPRPSWPSWLRRATRRPSPWLGGCRRKPTKQPCVTASLSCPMSTR